MKRAILVFLICCTAFAATQYTRRVIVIMTAADKDRANTQWKQAIDTVNGDRTFTTGLIDSNGVTTHYWMSGLLREAEYAAMTNRLATQFPDAIWREWTNIEADPVVAQRLLTQLGLKTIPTAKETAAANAIAP